LYAMGVAGDPERSEIRAHLDRRCEVCTQGLKRARELAALMAGSAPSAAPSAKLRRRVLASAGHESGTFVWIPVLAGALAFSLIACFYFAGRERDVGRELVRVTGISRQQNIELTRMNEVLRIINGADTRVSTFGEGKSTPPAGKVFISPSQGVALLANNLPRTPGGKAFEMWVIPKGGAPRPAGVFQSADGSAIHVQRGRLDADADVIAVTVEDAGGVPAPTSAPLFAVPIRSVIP